MRTATGGLPEEYPAPLHQIAGSLGYPSPTRLRALTDIQHNAEEQPWPPPPSARFSPPSKRSCGPSPDSESPTTHPARSNHPRRSSSPHPSPNTSSATATADPSSKSPSPSSSPTRSTESASSPSPTTPTPTRPPPSPRRSLPTPPSAASSANARSPRSNRSAPKTSARSGISGGDSRCAPPRDIGTSQQGGEHGHARRERPLLQAGHHEGEVGHHHRHLHRAHEDRDQQRDRAVRRDCRAERLAGRLRHRPDTGSWHQVRAQDRWADQRRRQLHQLLRVEYGIHRRQVGAAS